MHGVLQDSYLKAAAETWKTPAGNMENRKLFL